MAAPSRILRNRPRQAFTVAWRAEGTAVVQAPTAAEAEAMVKDGLERFPGDVMWDQSVTDRSIAAVDRTAS